MVRALTHALTSGRLHHAYLFTGTRGVGKTTLARILAKCLNCELGITATPCGVCQTCLDIDAGRFSDLLEVDAATNTRVEEMRELLDNAHYLPVSGRFKVYIIDEVHMLSRNAFNAMLKTLEEPPAHMKFILATTDPQKVPVTVLSRCLQFGLKPMTVEQLVSRLQFILDSEQVHAEPEALRLIAKSARGSVRDSLSVLDQAIAFGGGGVKAQGVAELLGVVSEEAVFSLAQALCDQDGPRLVNIAESLVNDGQSADLVLQEFAALMQKCALIQLASDVNNPEPEEVRALAQKLGIAQVQLCYQIALAGRRDLSQAPDELAGLIMTVLRMLAFVSDQGSSESVTVSQARSDSSNAGRVTPSSASLSAGRATPSSAPFSPPKHSIPVVSMPLKEGRSQAFPLPDSSEDWVRLVESLPAGGAPLELARHCVWKGRTGQKLSLSLPQSNKVLLAMTDRLAKLLSDCVGSVQLDIQLDLAVPEYAAPDHVAQQSVAVRDQLASQARLSAAEIALQEDPVVQSLIASGGKVVPDSIRPIKPH